MPIRLRLLIGWLLIASVLVVLGGLVFQHQLQAGLSSSVDSALRSRIDPLAQSVADAGNSADFADTPARFATPRESLQQVVAPDGRVVQGSDVARDANLLSANDIAAARRGPHYLTSRVSGERVRVLAVPVVRPDGTWLAVVGTSLQPTQEAADRVRGQVILAAAAVVLIGAAGTWLLGRAALRPVERMRSRAAQLSEVDAGMLPVPTTRDEVAALASTLNALLLRMHQALAAQRHLVADAGHEIRTPLSLLRAELELAGRSGRSTTELRTAVRVASEETERLIRLTEDLLLLASAEGGQLAVRATPQLVAAVLDSVATAWRTTAAAAGVAVSVEAPADLSWSFDCDRIRQALDNLVANALRSSPPGTEVRLRAGPTPAGLEFAVEDAGTGFPSQFIGEAFERFTRADPSRGRATGGAGLGLAVVRSIVQAHHGTVSATNLPGGGASVAFIVPDLDANQRRARRSASAAV